MRTNGRTLLRFLATSVAVSLWVAGNQTLAGETSSWVQKVSPAGKAATPARKPKKVKPRPVPGAASASRVSTPKAGSATGVDPAYSAFESGYYQTALERAKAAAENGDPAACTLIGRILSEGLGVAKDKAAAAAWYKKGSDLGDENAAFALGVLYATGDGVKKDSKKAANLFAKATKRGHAGATYNLALTYLSGTGRPRDVKGGVRLMQRAAQAGEKEAQYDLGTLYALGEGIDQDKTLAALWTGRAATRGLVAAQLEYAIMLFKGIGVEKNISRAVWFFRAAAERGNPVAQNRLATLYAFGVGIKQSRIEAAKWHLLARAKGVSDFKLDVVVSKLSSEQRAEVDQLVGEWADRALLTQ